MSKYNKKRVDKICSLIKKDSYTIAEICSLVGISESTYHEWKATKLEFSESIKRASDDFDLMLVVEAKKSLVKLIQGYTVQEQRIVTLNRTKKKDETGEPVGFVKEQTITDKHYQPNPTAIIFTLTNRDPENWKNRQNTELTGKDGKDLISGSLNVDEWIKAKSQKP